MLIYLKEENMETLDFMTWKEFIQDIQDGAFGQRFSDIELAAKLGTKRETIYKLKKGITDMPRQRTIDAIERNFNLKIRQHGNKITYVPVPHVGFKEAVSAPRLPLLDNIYSGHPDYLQTIHQGEYMYYPTTIETTSCFLLKINPSIQSSLKLESIVLVDMEERPREGDMVAVKLKNGRQFVDTCVAVDKSHIMVGNEVISKMDVDRIYKVLSGSVNF
jgi:SOS-response transcriptional repressor LexA